MNRIEGGVLVLGLLLAAGGAQVGAQVVGAKNPPATPAKGPATAAPAPVAGETLAVDFVSHVPPVDRENLKDYLVGLESRTRDRWLHGLPAAANPPLSTPGEVKIVCWVHTDGRVTNMMLEQPSGKVALDRAAWAAITGSSPYASFPYGIAVDQVKVRFTFAYNAGADGGQSGPPPKPR
jgi:TonB family protein